MWAAGAGKLGYNGSMKSKVFPSRRSLPRDLAAFATGLVLACTLIAPRPGHASLPPDEILYQSSDLKIYRTLSHGTPVVVLTNVDAEGNFLSGDERFRGGPQATPTRPAPGSPDAGDGRGGPSTESGERGAVPGRTPSGSHVRVVVNAEGDSTPVDQGNVDVTTDGTGGTTVVININPPSPEKRDTVEVPAPLVYPFVALGGLAGGFRYPEHLYFLGYGLDTSSPSMFGGLGLNAGNRFGLKTGKPCDRGFDCMFGPEPQRP